MKNNKGFTLVELLAVIVLLALLSLIGYTVVGNIIKTSQDAAKKQAIISYSKEVDKVSHEYYVKNFKYPDSDYIKENVKLDKGSVICDDVQFTTNDDIILNGCQVNDSSEKYCLINTEIKECNKGTTITKLYGNSVQDGTPSPTNPIEIQSVGDKTNNLFNQGSTKTASFSTSSNTSVRSFEEGVWYLGLTYNNYSIVSNLLDYKFGENTTMVKVNSQKLYGLAQAFKVQPGQIYSLNYDDGANGRIDFGFYDSNGNFLSSKIWQKGQTITIPSNAYWMTVCLSARTASVEVTFSNLQLVLGDVITDYEPYGKYKIPITVSEGVTSETVNIYLDMPLRKVGTVADYIDFENETIVRNVETIILDGKIGGYTATSNWYYAGFKSLGLTGALLPKGGNSSLISNKFENLSLSRNNENGIYYSSTVHFIIRNNSLTEPTKDSYQNWLSTNNVIVQYQLAEPLISSIDLPPASFFANKDISIGTSVTASFDAKEVHYTE